MRLAGVYVLYSLRHGHVLNTMGTYREMRTLLSDRKANGQAFADEKIQPLHVYFGLSTSGEPQYHGYSIGGR